MPYYIAKYQGDGETRETKFIPRFLDPEGIDWSIIDLRRDQSKLQGGNAFNTCLLWTDNTLPVHADFIKIAEDKLEILSNANLRSMESRLKMPVNWLELTRLDNVIAEILLKPPNENSWKRARPKRSTGTLPIRLGPWVNGHRNLIELGAPSLMQGLLEKAPGLFGYMLMAFSGIPLATVVTENFNGGDNAVPGIEHTWTERNSFDAENGSNQYQFDGAWANDGSSYDSCGTGVSTSDHYSQAVLVSLSRTGSFIGIGPCTRLTTSGNIDCFYYRDKLSGSGDGHNLERIVNESFSAGANDSIAPVTTSVTRLESDGSDHQGFNNGSSASAASLTNSGGAGELNGGIHMTVGDNSDVAAMDDFEIGDLAAVSRRKVLF